MSTYPIVGDRFRPPAPALIRALAIGTPLMLIAEPENPYDANAVGVWLNAKDIPEAAHASLNESLPLYGFELQQVLSEEMWHLGYIPREMAKTLREGSVVTVEEPVQCTFSTSPSGAPRVRLDEDGIRR